ncbi:MULTISPECIES: hypothetical protein [Corallococcus]|uniref:hypothetical protein n=1 Tax=Corallococcus TaxID=83461 RepID=UPI00117ED87B|nr:MULTISPECIES: hypothetical protein [Corallococcus]NBD07973.1 hypothetical protein [Corallococcus silvisoli]TSC33961.1 hypothetical protein FOF48_02635 [Corallococcus sp. Z5C101001]
MSDRADIVILKGGKVEIHHHRWGATALVELFQDGPEAAVMACRDNGSVRTKRLDDLLAGAVLDLDRRTLILAGKAEVIFAGSELKWPEDAVLQNLAPHWPGWTLGYEPSYVIEPLALYVRGLGIPLASLNEPHVVAGLLGKPRWTALAYRLDAVSGGGAAGGR